LLSTTLASAEPPPTVYAFDPPGTADAAKAPLAPVRAESAPPGALSPTRVHSPALAAGGALLGIVGIASLVGGLAVLGVDVQQSSHAGLQSADGFPDLSAI